MTTPGQTIGVSSFFDPLARDLALSRAEVALYYTVGTLAGILPAPLVAIGLTGADRALRPA